MISGLFVSHAGQRCGVYQFGRRLFSALQQGIAKSEEDITWVYAECDSIIAYETVAKALRPDITLFNYHPLTLAWAIDGGWGDVSGITFSILHEVYQEAADELLSEPFDFILCPDPTLVSRNPIVLRVPRFIPPVRTRLPPSPERFTVGTFGFATPNKGFVRLCHTINSQFDDAHVIINLPPHDWTNLITVQAARDLERDCRKAITKPFITVDIKNDFMTEDDLLDFLSSNTINAFLYEDKDSRGLSSCTDYALASGRPVAVSKSTMFRHLHGINPSLCIEDRKLQDIASSGVSPLLNHIKEYSEAISGATWNNAMLVALESKRMSRSVPDGRGFNKILDDRAYNAYSTMYESSAKLSTNSDDRMRRSRHVFERLILDNVERLIVLFKNPRLLAVGISDLDISQIRNKGYSIDEINVLDILNESPSCSRNLENIVLTYDIVICNTILYDLSKNLSTIQIISDLVAKNGIAIFIGKVSVVERYENLVDDEDHFKDWNFGNMLIDTLPEFKMVDTPSLHYINEDTHSDSLFLSVVVSRFAPREGGSASVYSTFLKDHIESCKPSVSGKLQSTLGKYGHTNSRMLSTFGGVKDEEGETIYQSNGVDIGFLLFGPYIPLLKGRYRGFVLIRLDDYIQTDDFVIILDVVSNGIPLSYKTLVTRRDLVLDMFSPIMLDFILENKTNRWEMRVELIKPIKVSVVALAAWRPFYNSAPQVETLPATLASVATISNDI